MDEAMTNSDVFILACNGPYANRGCEAITRGTVRILRAHFDSPRFLAYSFFKVSEYLRWQQSGERDPDIIHEGIWSCQRRFDGAWFATNILKRTFPGALKHAFYRPMKAHLGGARAVLALGGDNYSLDYKGPPILCTALDDLVVDWGKPLIIWGASVGPFSKNPAYERYMAEHLRKAHILARESLTIEYLHGLGLVENVHRVADPAFLMDSEEPTSEKLSVSIPEGAIGINLSPLLAKHVAGGNMDEWVAKAARIVASVIGKTQRPIFLIPHVTGIDETHDDYAFLSKVARSLGPNTAPAHVIPNTLNAAETKWVISRMALFAGARTHSTIAALSSCVPTLSFGYSVKSRGINTDVYGHTRYCLQPSELAPDAVADRVDEMLLESESIRKQLEICNPQMKELSLGAGGILRRVVEESESSGGRTARGGETR